MEKNHKNEGEIMTTKTHRPKYILTNDDIFESVQKRISAGHMGSTVFVPHVCNNIDLFGAGFAAQLAEKYPSVKQDYHLLGKHFLRNNFGYSQVLKVYEDNKFKHKLFFVNMIAQNGVKGTNNIRPLNYLALVKSMNTLSQYIKSNTGFSNKSEKIEIHCPKFGSGLAGGNWQFVSDLIDDIWGQFDVIVYNYPPKTNNKFND
jgi:hypothetical protein